MTTAKSAAALIASIIVDELREAIDAHRAGAVPRDPAQHWAWTSTRDSRLEKLEAVKRHLAALPPDSVIGGES